MIGDIRYTRHAEDKLRTSQSRKFRINKKKIKEMLKEPFTREALPLGVTRAVGNLDANRSLCIIYAQDDSGVRVITFFPAEKGRYEGKLLS